MFRLLICFVGLQLVFALPLDGTEPLRQPANNSTQFLYQILISQLEESPKCGGVLVGEGFILTSATCVLDFGGIKKFLEEAVLYGGGTSLLFNLGDVSDAVIHPQYTVTPRTYDVAVVKYIPQEKGPQVHPATLNGTEGDLSSCIMTSWWETPDTWPEHLMWQSVSITQCTPAEPQLFCFADETTIFLKDDLGSPVVCGGVLTGLVPRGGGSKAINITSDYDWIKETMSQLATSVDQPEPVTEEETRNYLIAIMQKLDELSNEISAPDEFEDQLTHWNKQVVVPLSYVLFALVIFFFVLLFFIVLFTVVLVYYSRK